MKIDSICRRRARISRLRLPIIAGVQSEKLKTNFQDFAAGTFYKEMLKSLRKMHGKPAYLYGGQAEKIFQGQMDQQVAENLAHSQGSQILRPRCIKAFLHQQRLSGS